jgi:hypothetical protein
MKIRKGKQSIALITGFRLLLWWGGQAVRSLFIDRRPAVQEEKEMQQDMKFPLSFWAFVSQKGYCLVSGQNDRKITIHPSGTIDTN